MHISEHMWFWQSSAAHLQIIPVWQLLHALLGSAGEIIPQALCSRHGLAIGAYSAWFVQILIWIVWVIAFPISKILDMLLGTEHGVCPLCSEHHPFATAIVHGVKETDVLMHVQLPGQISVFPPCLAHAVMCMDSS